MKPRHTKDIWQGLYDFFLVEPAQESDALHLLEQNLPTGASLEHLNINDPSTIYHHKLTHQHIQATFVIVDMHNQEVVNLCKKQLNLEEFELHEIAQLPKPILIDNYLKADIF